jgi:cob(I)alamin adenosyltransferase
MTISKKTKQELGRLQIYTGNGKGKTTAALGLAFRASGHGLKILIGQFMKDTGYYGEEIAARSIHNITWKTFGRHDFVNLAKPEEIDKKLALKGWAVAKTALHSGEYDMIILDEANVALACHLIPLEEMLEALQNRVPHTEVILTGRYAPKELLEIADLITEMTEIRHPYEKQLEARQGIEY